MHPKKEKKAGLGISLALLDLDGTLFRGKQVISGAPEFVERLRQLKIKPVFFTNNATRTPEETANHLRSLGIFANSDEVCTAAEAAAAFLSAEWRLEKGSHVAYIGKNGLRQALLEAGFIPFYAGHEKWEQFHWESFTAAVIGLDMDATYQSLGRLSRIAALTGRLLLTNGDIRIPLEGGSFQPGNGALGAFVSIASGVEAVTVGKPNAYMIHYASQRYAVSLEETLIVGDNLWTDIAAGLTTGIRTFWVESGVHLNAREMQDWQRIYGHLSGNLQTFSSVAEISAEILDLKS
ncbi:HAD-IIA family hydrolase [Alicyclobacillus sp. TC]|uniref:4-nitrophenyl phosphatase n=1 Tax=Alicyclobacillus tolerans TaxID=90970 RepID=A0A1M6MD38_9BACL|nr:MULTISPECIES: HAD-IIA family hydrolase [Alicyclobacillus]QRF23460.1 HAD-IIA family hydrolase [Alicyclobacillus sp. TC]SHJ81394.1 4-nitrophenyl phosphatase [Alicyclobacillus montanus]